MQKLKRRRSARPRRRTPSKGPILCFVGPPGVGKTSLGQSIARAMNRKFVRISLGGVRDEAEIRGHRRTYIGAIPGRIVQALKQAGAMNPVFMLDEIDKISAGFRAIRRRRCSRCSTRRRTTRSAITTSRSTSISRACCSSRPPNQLGTIHPALLDRMEIISLAGYSEEEKLHIARALSRSPRQLGGDTACRRTSVTIDDDARCGASSVDYTREAGVRSLERPDRRDRAEDCGARRGDGNAANASRRDHRRARMPDYLGPPTIHDEVSFRVSRPGVATGVAWTGDRRRRAVHRARAAAVGPSAT